MAHTWLTVACGLKGTAAMASGNEMGRIVSTIAELIVNCMYNMHVFMIQ